MVLGDTQVQHVPEFLTWILFGRPPLLAQCIELDVRLNYAAVQNLVYRCGNIPQTTAESSDTLPIHCAQHVQQSVDMSIQLPAGLQYDPVQMAEVVQHAEHVVSTNTVHLSKHHSYCLQSSRDYSI